MATIVCKDPPKIGPLEAHQLDQHSVLNIFNILLGKVYLLGLKVRGKQELFEETLEITRAYMEQLLRPEQAEAALRALPSFRRHYFSSMNRVLSRYPKMVFEPEVEAAIDNLESIFDVLRTRVGELEKRLEYGDAWLAHPVDALKRNFQEVFRAIEKNSLGRYRIVTNLARQGADDYFVDFEVESLRGDVLVMPPVFQDTMRDLVANARKYTAPGGRIAAGIYATPGEIRFVVEDNGVGIPEEELERVTEWGYRGSNVQDRPTMGGGFGLTKALYVVGRFHGQMEIRSARDAGTRISVQLPVNGHRVVDWE